MSNRFQLAGRLGAIAALAVASCDAPCAGQVHASGPRRARPPAAFSDEVRNAFVDDFRDLLEGARPAEGDLVAPAEGEAPNQQDQFRWSRLIDAETLTTEIKRNVNELSPLLAAPGRFKSGGHQTCRRVFGTLSTLFGVISQFDQEIRFRRNAATMRDSLAAASEACKSGDDAAYAAAAAAKIMLDELLRGQPGLREPAGQQFQWSDLAARALLMRRMKTALNERIDSTLADLQTFRREREQVRHEAQILALLAEVIAGKEYEFWDDESYVQLAAQLRDSSTALAEASQQLDLAAARAAASRAQQSCVDCHDGYR